MSSALDYGDGPVFPMEIFSQIIDMVAEVDDFDYRATAAALKTCSLVQSSFVPLVRAHQFGSIEVGFLASHSTQAEDRLKRILPAFKSQSRVLRYCRSFEVSFFDYAGTSLTLPELEQCAELLLTLPSISSLCISYRYKEKSLPPCLEVLRYRLVDTYAGHNTLSSLDVEKMDYLPFDKIFAAPNLQNLRLSQCPIPIIRHPHTQIKDLYLSYYGENDGRRSQFPLHLLRYFPSLENLGLSSASLILADSDYDADPSFSLIDITIDRVEIGSLARFVDFYEKYASLTPLYRIKPAPFFALERFEIRLGSQMDVAAAHRLLAGVASLNTLIISVDYPSDDEGDSWELSSLVDIDLRTLWMSSLRDLTHIEFHYSDDLEVEYEPGEEEYHDFLYVVHAVLSTIPRNNTIEYVKIYAVSNHDGTPDLPRADSWNPIGRCLGDPSRFPVLQNMEAVLELYGSIAAWSHISDEVVHDFLPSAMPELRDRIDVELESGIIQIGW